MDMNEEEVPSNEKSGVKPGDSGFMVLAETDDAYKLFEAPAGLEIIEHCLAVMRMLLEKNISYGNSATAPKQLFSKASSTERLLSRIDEKINRMANGLSYPGDDDLLDLIGYLILLRIVLTEEK